MRRVSKRRAMQLRQYAKQRIVFLEENPVCAFPLGCNERATTVQHVRGRFGWRLLDMDWWKPSCWSHNQWAEDNTGEALAIGWLVAIEGVA